MSYLIASDLELVCLTRVSRLTVNLLVHVVWCHTVNAFSPGAWQMVEMACSMLPSQTSHPGMALWTQAGSCYLAVDPSVGQAR